MKKLFTLKYLFVLAMFFGSFMVQAADLITEQVVVKLDEPGTLQDKIESAKKDKITNLKIVGKVNGTDWKLIREMAGRDKSGTPTNGVLSVLDLSEARIVEGGDSYSGRWGTENDKLGKEAFSGCSVLTDVTLPAVLTSIDMQAFWECSGLKKLNIPSGVTTIGLCAFYGCRSLTSLSLPPSLEFIDIEAFNACSSLTSISIPASVTSIGEAAFWQCYSLESIFMYSAKVPSLGPNLFYQLDKELCTVYVPKGTLDVYRKSQFGYFDNIVEFDATGVSNITTSTDIKEVARYSMNGQRLSAPSKGLNIVKYSDGSVKKVAVQ